MGQAKRGMAYAEYYADDLGKNIKSDSIVFSRTHVHGAQPTRKEVDGLIDDLIVEVARAYKGSTHTCPGDAAIRNAARIETYSAA